VTHGESTFSPITEDPGRRAGGRQAKPALEQQVPETRTALGEVEFGDKKKHPGLQAADDSPSVPTSSCRRTRK
jgi:hypothetical protein